MEAAHLEEYRRLNAIIERDSTDTTYKYALLRGAIDICQQYPQFAVEEGERVSFPMGLMVEKWLLYYYPIVAHARFIPQKAGERPKGGKSMAFRHLLSRICEYYQLNGGFSKFYSDYVRGTVPELVRPDLWKLCLQLRRTIATMPMKHLGYSLSRTHYSLFTYTDIPYRGERHPRIDREFLVKNLGCFSLSRELYLVFVYFGGVISGESSLLQRWVRFTISADDTLSRGEVMSILNESPLQERDIQQAIQFYRTISEKGIPLTCVWTGKSLDEGESFHIDHLLPFSVWRNNDLWNLLPADGRINREKRDKIPSIQHLEERKGEIMRYWRLMDQFASDLFTKEVRLSLTGNIPIHDNLFELAFEQLKKKSGYLIDVLGYEKWEH